MFSFSTNSCDPKASRGHGNRPYAKKDHRSKKTLCKKNLVQVASVRLQTLIHPSQLAETPKGQRSWTEVTFDGLKCIMEEWFRHLHEVSSEGEAGTNSLLVDIVRLPSFREDFRWTENCDGWKTCFDLESIPEFDSLVSRGGENPAVILKDKQRLLLKLKPGVRVERQNSPCVPTKPSSDTRRRITLCFDLENTPALHRLHNNNKYRVYPLNPQQWLCDCC